MNQGSTYPCMYTVAVVTQNKCNEVRYIVHVAHTLQYDKSNEKNHQPTQKVMGRS